MLNIPIKKSLSLIHRLLLPFILLASDLKAEENDLHLEQLLSQDSIVSCRQIKIPDYPGAYNPSLIPYNDGYLLSFRLISRPPKKLKMDLRTDISFIGVVRLDKKFRVIDNTAQILNIASYSPQFSLSAEDARLLNVEGRIFLFFNDIPPLHTPGTHAMYFGELIEKQGVFSLKGAAKPLNYSNAVAIEKNWSPFALEGRLYVIYSDQPRVILEIDLSTGRCLEAARFDRGWNWALGQIRGGTPAHLVEDSFLTFFHSWFPANTRKGKAYFMGAYTFEKDPPFAVRLMTANPLGRPEDYSEENELKVVFPGGLVVENSKIHVAWGKADKQIFITTFDKEKLLASMTP